MQRLSVSHIAANVLGTAGAVCWSVQLIPQIVINYRRHHAIDLHSSMMMLWAWAGVPLGVYNVVRDFNLPLQVQPQILTTLSLVTWIQCHYYQRRWSLARCLLVVIPLAAVMAGIEAGLIFALKTAEDRTLEWPLTLMAVLSAAFLAAGVLVHYVDIYRHRTVRGISFLFVGIDAAGDLFSLLSILFQPSIDVLGLVIYTTELVLWLGVMGCGVYFNLLPRLRERMREESGHQQEASYQQGSRPGASIALHDLHSSTSVFRTPSSGLVSRSVTAVTLQDHIRDTASLRAV